MPGALATGRICLCQRPLHCQWWRTGPLCPSTSCRSLRHCWCVFRARSSTSVTSRRRCRMLSAQQLRQLGLRHPSAWSQTAGSPAERWRTPACLCTPSPRARDARRIKTNPMSPRALLGRVQQPPPSPMGLPTTPWARWTRERCRTQWQHWQPRGRGGLGGGALFTMDEVAAAGAASGADTRDELGLAGEPNSPLAGNGDADAGDAGSRAGSVVPGAGPDAAGGVQPPLTRQ